MDRHPGATHCGWPCGHPCWYLRVRVDGEGTDFDNDLSIAAGVSTGGGDTDRKIATAAEIACLPAVLQRAELLAGPVYRSCGRNNC